MIRKIIFSFSILWILWIGSSLQETWASSTLTPPRLDTKKTENPFLLSHPIKDKSSGKGQVEFLANHRTLTGASFLDKLHQGKGITVGFFETDVDPTHPIFSIPNVNLNAPKQSVLLNLPDPKCIPKNSHGTHVAGLIAGQRVNLKKNPNQPWETLSLGIAPQARLVHVADEKLTQAIKSQKGAEKALSDFPKFDILNYSRGSLKFLSTIYDPNLRDRKITFDLNSDKQNLLSALFQGTHLVCCALANDRNGNDKTFDSKKYSEAIRNFSKEEGVAGRLLTVGALTYTPTTGEESIASFSQREDQDHYKSQEYTTTNTIFAPGHNILSSISTVVDPQQEKKKQAPSTRPKEVPLPSGTPLYKKFDTKSGTSMATPIVAGGLALLQGAFPLWKEQNKFYTHLILAGARDENLMAYAEENQFFPKTMGAGAADFVRSCVLAAQLAYNIHSHEEKNPYNALRMRTEGYQKDFVQHIWWHRQLRFLQQNNESTKQSLIQMYGPMIADTNLFNQGDAVSSTKRDILFSTWATEKTYQAFDKLVNRLDAAVKTIEETETQEAEEEKRGGKSIPKVGWEFYANFTLPTDPVQQAKKKQKRTETKEFYLKMRQAAMNGRDRLHTKGIHQSLVKDSNGKLDLYRISEGCKEHKIMDYFQRGGGPLYDKRILWNYDVYCREDKAIYLNARYRQHLNLGLQKILEPEVSFRPNLVPFNERYTKNLEKHTKAVSTALTHAQEIDLLYFNLKEQYPHSSHMWITLLVQKELSQKGRRYLLKTSETAWKTVQEIEKEGNSLLFTIYDLQNFIQKLQCSDYSPHRAEKLALYYAHLFRKILPSTSKEYLSDYFDLDGHHTGVVGEHNLFKFFDVCVTPKFNGTHPASPLNDDVCEALIDFCKDKMPTRTAWTQQWFLEAFTERLPFLLKSTLARPKTLSWIEKIFSDTLERLTSPQELKRTNERHKAFTYSKAFKKKAYDPFSFCPPPSKNMEQLRLFDKELRPLLTLYQLSSHHLSSQRKQDFYKVINTWMSPIFDGWRRADENQTPFKNFIDKTLCPALKQAAINREEFLQSLGKQRTYCRDAEILDLLKEGLSN